MSDGDSLPEERRETEGGRRREGDGGREMIHVDSIDIVPTADKHRHTPGKKIPPHGSSFSLIPSLISLCCSVWAI